MPRQPETEEDVLDLIAAEEAKRRERGYPEHIIRSAGSDVREAFANGWEFVGAVGGLRWSKEHGWE